MKKDYSRYLAFIFSTYAAAIEPNPAEHAIAIHVSSSGSSSME
jgi:hypothetical protein